MSSIFPISDKLEIIDFKNDFGIKNYDPAISSSVK